MNLSLQVTSNFYNYAVVQFQESFIYFGGAVDSVKSSVIAKFDSTTRQWSNLGNLARSRKDHGAIFDGAYFLVAGGYSSSYKTEKCSFSGSTITCQQQEPTLSSYEQNPELFLVSDGFCKKLDY